MAILKFKMAATIKNEYKPFYLIHHHQAEINSRARGARKCFRAPLKKNWGAREEPEVP